MKQTKKVKKNKGFKEISSRSGYRFFMPWLIGFIIFTAFPFIYTIFLSFHQVNLTVLGWTTTFTGIANYVTALLRNANFTPSLIQFVLAEIVYVPVIVTVALILAILMNGDFKFRTVFRIIYFLPVIVISGTVMTQLMNSGTVQLGNVRNVFIYQILSSYSPFLASMLTFLFNNFTIVLWFSGIPVVLFLNGLQKINGQLFEAAQIDGATGWQILWKITLPIIKPIILVATIFTIVQLGMFPINPVYGMIQLAIFDTVGGLGVASAYAWIYSLAIIILLAIAFLLLKDHSKDYQYVDVVRLQNEKLEKMRKRVRRQQEWNSFLRKRGAKHGKA
jgi:oligogalacturonide transport system permease protein